MLAFLQEMHLDWIKLVFFKNLSDVKGKVKSDLDGNDLEKHIDLKRESNKRVYIQFAVLCSSIYVVYLLNALVEEKM